MTNPKISVILSAYNEEKFIRKAIESVVNQTLKDIEIIIINDGSTDNTLEIINSYADKDSRIVVIDQENIGLGASRNKGMKIAKGEYLLFVDSDDLIIDNTLKGMLHIATQNQVDILKGDYVKANNQEIENGIEIANQNSYTPSTIKTGEQGFIEDHNPMYSYVWQFLFKRSFIIDNNLFFLEGKYFEDVAYTIEAYLKAKTFMSIPLQFYVYRQNDSSIMATMSVNKLYSMNEIIVSLLETINQYKSLDTPYSGMLVNQ